MKAKFIGDPSDDFSGPAVLRHAGATFPYGQFVGVSDEVAAKLENHSHFEVAEGDAPAYEAPAEPKAASEGKAAGGGKAADKAGLITALEAIQAKHPDFTFNAKASAAKLQEALEEARFEFGDDE